MEFSVPGFIKRFCTPNALLTLTEYLIDYASDEVKEKGWKQIDKEIAKIEDPKLAESIKEKIEKIKQGERDLYY
jgi:2-iminoacetate synthase